MSASASNVNLVRGVDVTGGTADADAGAAAADPCFRSIVFLDCVTNDNKVGRRADIGISSEDETSG